MNRKQLFRIAVIVSAVCFVSLVAVNGVQVASSENASSYDRFESSKTDVTRVAEPRPNGTVFTAYGRGGGGHLVAINPNGTLKYYLNEHDEYYDVDPLGDGRVLVAAMQEYNKNECPGQHSCTLEQILIVNLDTGNTTTVYERYRKGTGNNEWHDVDKISDNEYLIAGMEEEQVFIVNSSTEVVTWAWDPQSNYNISTGGSRIFGTSSWPYDWTHLNDVERLSDGRIMVSMRNHDQVIFLNKSTGMQESWTLGENDNTSILFEQHNPDYIPSSDGGPAVVIADSQNNRIVEYERRSGRWEQTWQWTDLEMQWPRDADRLPNGHTLIADTNSGRIIEVNQNGTVEWSISRVPGVYDVERLNTGDESASGQSASELNLSGVYASTGALDRDADTSSWRSVVKSAVPAILLNALLYIKPSWWSWLGFDGAVFILLCTSLLLAISIKLTTIDIQIRFPITRGE